MRLGSAIATALLSITAGSAAAQLDVFPSERQRPELPDTLPAPEPPIVELPPLDLPPESAPLARGEGVRILGFRIEGNTVFDDAELKQLLAPYSDRLLYSEDLPRITDRLTRYYNERGYVTSGAILPDQDVADGIIDIQVIEGRLAEVELVGSPRLREHYVASRLRRRIGRPLDIAAVERSLQILQRDVRIERIDAVLLPGASADASILRVALVEARPQLLRGRFANDVAPSLGGLRGELIFAHRNMTGNGDELHFDVSGGAGLRKFYVRYDLPVGPFETAVHAFFDSGFGKVVEGGLSLNQTFTNDYQSYGIRLSQPVYRSLDHDVVLGLQLERRTGRLELNGAPFLLELPIGASPPWVQLSLIRLDQQWTYRDLAQVFALRLTETIGLDVADATTTANPLFPDGQFFAFLAQLQYARRLPERVLGTELVVRGDLQLANERLFALERISVGGLTTVRGYHQNELVRDMGLVLSAELRIPVLKRGAGSHSLQLIPFVDLGWAWDKDLTGDTLQSGVEIRNRAFESFIGSIGVGFRYDYRQLFDFSFYWGGRLEAVPDRPGDELQNNGIFLELNLNLF